MVLDRIPKINLLSRLQNPQRCSVCQFFFSGSSDVHKQSTIYLEYLANQKASAADHHSLCALHTASEPGMASGSIAEKKFQRAQKVFLASFSWNVRSFREFWTFRSGTRCGARSVRRLADRWSESGKLKSDWVYFDLYWLKNLINFEVDCLIDAEFIRKVFLKNLSSCQNKCA